MRMFDKSISVGNGYTSKQSKANASVGSDVLERIIDTYPDLNPLWLLTGEGEMIREITKKHPTKNTTEEPPLQYDTIDDMINHKIESSIQRQFKVLLDKLDTFPTMEDIRKEIEKMQKSDQ
ncbi:hypothetical protein C8N46_101357 [Kordia periserrulae]|uniref:Uncharacterized protein n=2 Tax=Kordia periserrulae TaxID=701523 RepID=A0A2T6C624_9FLAO|nr:hypothetical protein C8N46_101357 [Kordia periserrulae]